MEELLKFFIAYEVWIYVLIGGVALIYLQKVLSAWREWQGALFGLEKESSQKKFSTSMTVFMLLLMVALAEFLMVSFIAPSYPKMASVATPTLNVVFSPTATSRAGQALAGQTLTVITPTPGGLPTAVPVTTEGCSPGKVEWTFPKTGQQLQGIVSLKGTVNLPNLGFYKYEYNPAGNANWTTIAAGNQVKVAADLGGQWNTGQLTPGDYRLRLVVADSQNNVLPACVISIRIVAP